MYFKSLSILGVGLLGGSIGLALRAHSVAMRVVGYGHRPQTLRRALEIGAIDEAREDLAGAAGSADLVVLCTPVGLFESILGQIGPALRPGAVVTDVGSTKRSVVAAAGRILPKGVHFVGSHPMAGSEKRGVDYARADLFDNALCITTPTAATHRPSLKRVEQFWQAIGMRTTRLSPEDHDRHLADVSHLPHAAAAALVMMQADAALPLAGKGFLDSTRIAGGDGALWRDILLDNRDNLRSGIERLQGQLSQLLDMLDGSADGDRLRQWLDAAAGRRETLLKQKLHEVTPD